MQILGYLLYNSLLLRCACVPLYESSQHSKAASACVFWVKQRNAVTQHHTVEHSDLQQHHCENLSLILLCQ